MKALQLIELGAVVLAVAWLLLVFLRHRKTSDLFHRYAEAMQAENNGEEEKAIHLYRDALTRSQRMTRGDQKLKSRIEQRLKTLEISTDFEKSFRKGLAG